MAEDDMAEKLIEELSGRRDRRLEAILCVTCSCSCAVVAAGVSEERLLGCLALAR